jgi:hypothetical protein
MKKDHEANMASKDYVNTEVSKVDSKIESEISKVDLKVETYKLSHEEIHKNTERRFDEMFKMVQFLYQSEINRNK